MAPLTRTGMFACLALTFEYALLSIVLNISRQPTSGSNNVRTYHGSSAVLLTELFKIIVSTLLVLWTRELRPKMLEMKKQRHARENEEEVEPEQQAWLLQHRRHSSQEKQDKNESEDEGSTTSRRTSLEKRVDYQVHDMNGSGESLTTSPTSRNKSSKRTDSVRNNNSLRVNVAAAQAHHSSAPSLALIPATPAKPPSPAHPTDSTALHPTRIPFHPGNLVGGSSGLLDIFERDAWVALRQAVMSPGWWKLAVPSVLFMFQANAQYVAGSNLSVPVFQLAYQLKIPATALFSVLLLNRILSIQQWISLTALTLGVGIVQLASLSTDGQTTNKGFDIERDGTGPNQVLGLAAVGAACLSSGFANIYFERILKSPSSSSSSSSSHSSSKSISLSSSTSSKSSHSRSHSRTHSSNGSLSNLSSSTSSNSLSPVSTVPPPSIWIRNIQLSLFGLVVAFPVAFYHIRGEWRVGEFEEDWLVGAHDSVVGFWDEFFQGFGSIAWMVVFLQVLGGLLGALVQQHADNIAKCFSTSLSILISFVASVGLFGFTLTYSFAIGATLVLFATWTYQVPGGLSRLSRGLFGGRSRTYAPPPPPPPLLAQHNN
ncbi:hypothetical protein T439DRAFT_327640 [Meredithblackwellia eburnea MCA 4105]